MTWIQPSTFSITALCQSAKKFYVLSPSSYVKRMVCEFLSTDTIFLASGREDKREWASSCLICSTCRRWTDRVHQHMLVLTCLVEKLTRIDSTIIQLLSPSLLIFQEEETFSSVLQLCTVPFDTFYLSFHHQWKQIATTTMAMKTSSTKLNALFMFTERIFASSSIVSR